MDSKHSLNRLYTSIKTLEASPDKLIFRDERIKKLIGRVLCGIGAILIFLTIQGFLPEKLDAILHYEILFWGYFIGILGLFLVSRLMAYILIIFVTIQHRGNLTPQAKFCKPPFPFQGE